MAVADRSTNPLHPLRRYDVVEDVPFTAFAIHLEYACAATSSVQSRVERRCGHIVLPRVGVCAILQVGVQVFAPSRATLESDLVLLGGKHLVAKTCSHSAV